MKFNQWLKLRESHYVPLSDKELQQELNKLVAETKQVLEKARQYIGQARGHTPAGQYPPEGRLQSAIEAVNAIGNDVHNINFYRAKILIDILARETNLNDFVPEIKQIAKNFQVLFGKRGALKAKNSYPNSNFFIGAFGSERGYLGNKDYQTGQIDPNHPLNQITSPEEMKKFHVDINTKKKLLGLLEWIEQQIGSNADGKNLIQFLHKDVYDYQSWLIALDIADDLDADTSKIRSFLKTIFETMPPTEGYGHKNWYYSQEPEDWR